MMQSRKSARHRFINLSQHSSFALKVCLVFAVTLAVCVNFRFAYSAIYGSTIEKINDNSDVKRDRIQEFQSLPTFPDNPLSLSIQEWDQWTQEPMIGIYRYSPTAIMQLPTADLEPKSTTSRGMYAIKMKNIKSKVQVSTNEYENTRTKNSSFLSNDIVALTRKGYKFNPEDGIRTPNQDRVLVLSKQEFDKNGDNDNYKDWWIGLFDGHGYHGHAVSQYCSLKLANHIHKLWEMETTMAKDDMIDTLRGYFLDTNRFMPHFDTSGSTGISVLRRGNSLYISNVGDSMAFVASYNSNNNNSDSDNDNIKIIYTTKPHKPDSSGERKRIEKAGGHVQDSPFVGASSRLIIPIGNGPESVGLAMSRSLGDHDGENVGLTAEPDTDILDLTQFDKNKEYVVVAVTDGLVDYQRLSVEEVALSMAKALSSSSTSTRSINYKQDRQTSNQRVRKQKNNHRQPSSMSPEAAAAKLILKASQLWNADPNEVGYRDDISIVAHKIRI